MYCSALMACDVPEGVTSIGAGAFAGCTSLLDVSLPDSLQSIGMDAFTDLSASAYTVEDGAYYLGNRDNPYVALIKFTDDQASYFAPHPDTKCLGTFVFAGFINLEQIDLPDGIKEIPEFAFANCRALKSVSFASDIVAIGNSAFMGTDALKSIVIPDTVEYMGKFVFDSTSGITEVLCEAETQPIGWSAEWIYDHSLVSFGKKQ